MRKRLVNKCSHLTRQWTVVVPDPMHNLNNLQYHPTFHICIFCQSFHPAREHLYIAITGSSNSRSRNRSISRNHHSHSRGTSCGTSHSRRSRSRSTSIAPLITSGKGDTYHSNLFRGAALIREHLLRSMASADKAMAMESG